MKKILVTGASGFIGKNLCVALRRMNCEVLEFNRLGSPELLAGYAAAADLVYHLAGVNRPKNEAEFTEGNVTLTHTLCRIFERAGRRTPLVLSSSIQAAADNSYGRSKKAAEDLVLDYHRKTGAPVYLYRFPNVFGKWSKPNYNTVVATFCYNISRGLPTCVNDPTTSLQFVYIDDIVQAFSAIAGRNDHETSKTRYDAGPVYRISVGELQQLILSFRENRNKSLIPDLSNLLNKYLYSTYLSFHDTADLAYPIDLKTDARGWLFELIKSHSFGQIFVSLTRPGVTRGNHCHDTKIEKFCVIQGQGNICFRHVLGHELIEYAVSDREIRIVDIPPGYTHSLTNTGSSDMVTLFWANEIFDSQRPDTHFVKVIG
jgi:UDP-2-acetamido-2,6-beta-L-arabino-hexul-4-ose reductase